MKFEQIYTQDGRGQINILSGPVTDVEFIAAYEARFADLEKFKKLRFIISDMSNVTTFNLTKDTVKIVSDIAKSYAIHNKDLYIAGIHTKDLVFGLGKMWQAYSGNDITGWVTKSFRTKDEAYSWLQDKIPDIVF